MANQNIIFPPPEVLYGMHISLLCRICIGGLSAFIDLTLQNEPLIAQGDNSSKRYWRLGEAQMLLP